MIRLDNFEFAQPIFLWGLLLIPLISWWYWHTRYKRVPNVRVSDAKGMNHKNLRVRLYPLLSIFKILAIALLWVALARPRTVDITKQRKTNRGIDIVMAIDVSSSMLARDLRPSRLDALKQVAVDFANRRFNDRIGIVVYSGESFTKTPVTSDKRIVTRSIAEVVNGEIADGTAIGMGLGASVNRLKNSKSKSKIIILLTDGVNNTGFIDPKTASDLAREMDIKVYTIGIGTNGMAQMPYARDNRGNLLYKRLKVEIDEKLLQEIADDTGGRYFRATDNESLQEIYDEIDQLETSELEEFKYYNYQEYFRVLVAIAMILAGLSFVLRQTLFTGIF